VQAVVEEEVVVEAELPLPLNLLEAAVEVAEHPYLSWFFGPSWMLKDNIPLAAAVIFS
jgi:hypothetical protein